MIVDQRVSGSFGTKSAPRSDRLSAGEAQLVLLLASSITDNIALLTFSKRLITRYRTDETYYLPWVRPRNTFS